MVQERSTANNLIVDLISYIYYTEGMSTMSTGMPSFFMESAMNTLSWLIYLAEVLSSADHFAGVVAGLAGILVILLGIGLFVFSDDDDDSANLTFVRKSFKTSVIVCSVASLFAVILPSKQTIILIAASELGQTVIQSEGAQRVIDPSLRYVESWLNNEIARLQRESQPRQ